MRITRLRFGSYALSVGRGTASSTSLGVSSTTLTAGQSVTFSAAVTGPGHSSPVGTVSFTSGSVNLGTVPVDSAGNASLTTSPLTPGTYPVVASFTGQQGSTPSQSTPVTLTISKISDTLVLTATPNPATVGTPVTISAVVQYAGRNSFVPTGTVTIKDGSSTIATVSLIDGAAIFSTSSLPAGPHALSASYSGDANFASSTATATLNVTP